jgi:hypothetical protein
MKMRYGDFLRLVESALHEDDQAAPPPPPQPFTPSDDSVDDQNASLDNQVDDYLSQYESEAQSQKTEGMNLSMMTRRLLGEAPGDDDPLDADVPGTPPTTNNPDEEPAAPDDSVVAAPTLLPSDNIDLEAFGNSVHRLIENFQALVEVKQAVHKRAVKFLSTKYESAAVDQYKQIMRDQYYIDDENSESATADDQNIAPDAVGAGEFQTPAG